LEPTSLKLTPFAEKGLRRGLVVASPLWGRRAQEGLGLGLCLSHPCRRGMRSSLASPGLRPGKEGAGLCPACALALWAAKQGGMLMPEPSALRSLLLATQRQKGLLLDEALPRGRPNRNGWLVARHRFAEGEVSPQPRLRPTASVQSTGG
jgi:hypothetical protein